MQQEQEQQQHPSTAPSPAAKPAGGDHHQILLLDVTLESVAPVHATGDVELLTDVRAPAPDEQEEAFGFGFGGAHRVAAVGRLLATPRFDVPDFRHVPGLDRRRVVVSVFELAQRGLVVRFGPRTCDVKDASTGEVVGEGRRRDGRYYLDYLRVPPASS